jgi:hypothetical protein
MFPVEFPQSALLEVIKGHDADTAHLVLAGYELLGYGLRMYFGDVQFMPQADFDVIARVVVGAETAQRIAARAQELKGSGFGIAMIVIKLVIEFGPQILKLVESIRELLKKKA